MTDTDLVGFEKPPVERRRTMASGQVRKTPLGDLKFILKVDLPATMEDDSFKRYMGEYAQILAKCFPYQGV